MATVRPRYTETHCGWGHELSSDNLRTDPSGRRRCLACQKRSKRNADHGPGAHDWWELKVIEQNGLCLLCGEYFGEDLCLDHDHNTGEWRALLCKFCNLLTGWIENRREIIMNAEKYLDFFKVENNHG